MFGGNRLGEVDGHIQCTFEHLSDQVLVQGTWAEPFIQ